MQILPVLDLMGGQVVRGMGGRRHEYRPIVSRLVAGSAPLAVARAFRDVFGFELLYVADLDAIAGQGAGMGDVLQPAHDGFQLWVDAGVAAGTAEQLAEIGVDGVIAGLESLAGALALGDLLKRLGAERLVFSLDMKEGVLLGSSEGWRHADPWNITKDVVEMGVRRLLLLDLASVGQGQGTPTLAMCRRLCPIFPDVEFATGGGVRDLADLTNLKHAGVKFALVASALHDGKLK